MSLSVDADARAAWRERRNRIASAAPEDRARLLGDHARLVRRMVIETIATAGQGHVGGDLSVTDILTVLFEYALRIEDPESVASDDDRFVLSKGHCAASLYVTLANSGYFPRSELSTFMAPGSALNGHPNRNKVPGVETNTGPLGHGLPFAVGLAKGAKLTGSPSRVFVVLGDGEMQEGSNWEAIMSASQFGLNNLTLIVDRNTLQQGARTEATVGLEPLSAKLEAFGLEVRDINGHDYLDLASAFEPASDSRPVGVIANTLKGRGVSFMEDGVQWHHRVPSDAEVELALEELAG